jgi:zinc transport system substrate-binding protein
MKKIIFTTLLFNTLIFANINTIVSILPQKTFVKAIGGDKVNVSLMVLPGDSPHTYEPKPSQMKDVAKATLYFAIGVEFEHVWLPKFQSLNPDLKIIDLTQDIHKIPMTAHNEHNEHHQHEQEGLDPHIWTSPANVKIIAHNIYKALQKADPGNTNYYKKNLDAFLVKIDETDKAIKKILSSIPKGAKFMVFHPSWGYFAKAYGLEQLPVEVEGKSPKPRELIHLIKKAREEKIKAIFTQPEFSDATAKIIAKELGIPVIKVSPMDAHWSQNLIKMAKAIAGND